MFTASIKDADSTDFYTLSLHDALPIWRCERCTWLARSGPACARPYRKPGAPRAPRDPRIPHRSEEHTSELQSQSNIVCRLLLEKKNYICIRLEFPFVSDVIAEVRNIHR